MTMLEKNKDGKLILNWRGMNDDLCREELDHNLKLYMAISSHLAQELEKLTGKTDQAILDEAYKLIDSGYEIL
jgi:hypothetical protein